MRLPRRQLATALVAALGIALAAGEALADHRDFAGKVREVSKKRVTIDGVTKRVWISTRALRTLEKQAKA